MAIFVKLVFTPCCGDGDVLEFNVIGESPSTWWGGPAAVWTYTPNPVNPLLEGCYFVERIELTPGEANPINPAPQDSEMTYVAADCEAASNLDTSCNCTPCYMLTDCAGLLPPIHTQTDISEHLGNVITLADSTNHEIKGCWLVEEGEFCFNIVEVAVYKCYDTCEDCLPTPLPPEVPCPRPVDPGYSTGLCDPSIVENIMCTFSEMVYQQMMSQRYKIDYCCLPDEENVIIKFEKIQIKLRESESLVPDPCDPKCFAYEINIIGADSAVTTYVDCFEVEQVIITPVDTDPLALPRMIGFCALDTSVPTTVVTHPNDTIDTYILERVQDCVPPYVVPIACTGYQVRMSNLNTGEQRFRYLDCNGEEVIISLPGKQPQTYYYFCGIEGQTITRDFVFLPQDVFLVNLVPCTVEPPCTQYTFTLNSELSGVIEYIGCDNIWTEVPYLGQLPNQVIIICGQPYQTFSDYAPYFNYFEVIETGSC